MLGLVPSAMADFMAAELYLGIDTASSYLALALYQPAQGEVAALCEPVGRGHAQRLLPALTEMLARANCERHDIAGIGVGIGPGSYTGLRVGLASAQGLARALNVPVCGEESLAAMAYAQLSSGETGLVAFDARRGNVYAARYMRHDDKVERLDSISKQARETLQARYPSLCYVENAPLAAVYLAQQAAKQANNTSLRASQSPAIQPLYL